MIKFALGFTTCLYLSKKAPTIIGFLENQVAKLELHRDILKHDNPDIN